MTLQDFKKFGILPNNQDTFNCNLITGSFSFEYFKAVYRMRQDEAKEIFKFHGVNSFAMRRTPAKMPVDPCCPIVLYSDSGSVKKCLAGQFNWEIDSILWNFYKPDLAGCEVVLVHCMTKAA